MPRRKNTTTMRRMTVRIEEIKAVQLEQLAHDDKDFVSWQITRAIDLYLNHRAVKAKRKYTRRTQEKMGEE